MIRGLYAAAAGMAVHALRHDLAAGNLANLQTPGYRAERPVLVPFARLAIARWLAGGATPLGTLAYAVTAAGVRLVPGPGPLRETGRALDVALEGDGFLVVATPDGPRYTRDGRLALDAQRLLVDVAGRPVLGEAGPIRLPQGGDPVFAPDGAVLVGGQTVGRLQRVRFPRPDLLVRTREGLYAATEGSGAPEPAAATRLRQGFLELANVDPAAESVILAESLRAFEALQVAARAQHETLALATRELARF